MVFKDERVLLPEYLPNILPHRENQISLLANNLKPIEKNKPGINTFIFGPPGIGKTAVVKYVLREFENYSNVKTIYLNCWDFKTAPSVLSEITIQLGIPVSRRGWSKDEIFSRFLEAVRKNNTGIVVALDEVDQLVRKDPTTLYDLVRVGEQTKKYIGLVLISNDEHIFSNVEPRIKSSLQLDEIEFKPYSVIEMKDIVEERMKLAFRSFEPGVSALVAARAVEKNGDVRVALDILLKAGRIAEREGAKTLKVKHVKSVIAKNPKEKIVYEKLNENEKIIYDLLEKPMSTKELYKKFLKHSKITERMFRNYIDHMINSGVLRIVGMKDKARVVERRKW